jgi:hypothetical protein
MSTKTASESARVSAGAAVDAAALHASAGVEALVIAASTRAAANVLAATRKNKINALWEYVQAVLAVSLTASVIFAALVIHVVPDALDRALFLVMGFYFGRTNHSRPTPTKPQGEVE